MSYPIVLCVVAVEALNLALLWIALRVSMSRGLRPLVAGFGMSGAWGAWILALVLRAPVEMTAFTAVVFAISSVAMGIAIHRATVEEEGRQDGGQGGAPPVVPETPGGGGNDEPVWWPEFQRQLAAYAARPDRAYRARTDRERQPVDC